MKPRLTIFNSETGFYEYKEKAKTWDEFNAQRFDGLQKLGRLEDKEEMTMRFIPKERTDEQR